MHAQCSTRPTVTFPDIGHRLHVTGTKLYQYCLVIEACVCVNNLPEVVTQKQNHVGLKLDVLAVTPARHSSGVVKRISCRVVTALQMVV